MSNYADSGMKQCQECGYEQLELVEGKYCNQCAINKGLIDNPFPENN